MTQQANYTMSHSGERTRAPTQRAGASPGLTVPAHPEELLARSAGGRRASGGLTSQTREARGTSSGRGHPGLGRRHCPGASQGTDGHSKQHLSVSQVQAALEPLTDSCLKCGVHGGTVSR